MNESPSPIADLLKPKYHFVDISAYDWKSVKDACANLGLRVERVGGRQALNGKDIDPRVIYYVIEEMCTMAYGRRLSAVMANTSFASVSGRSPHNAGRDLY